MKKFELKCRCGSPNTEIFSCEKVKPNVVEITYICNFCTNTESVQHFLYGDKQSVNTTFTPIDELANKPAIKKGSYHGKRV